MENCGKLNQKYTQLWWKPKEREPRTLTITACDGRAALPQWSGDWEFMNKAEDPKDDSQRRKIFFGWPLLPYLTGYYYYEPRPLLALMSSVPNFVYFTIYFTSLAWRREVNRSIRYRSYNHQFPPTFFPGYSVDKKFIYGNLSRPCL